MLSSSQKSKLLLLARRSIIDYFDNKETRFDNKKEFSQKLGVFVTLKENDHLRGCIGLIESPYPLWEGIIKMARAAAFDDPRFPSLNNGEIDDMQIEISILTKPVATTLGKIKKGDGIIIRLGRASSLFLPQVWDELKDKELFLSELCLKAFLSKDAWKEKGMKFFKFSAEAFEE